MSKVFASFRWLLFTLILRKGLVFLLFVVLARVVPQSAFGMFGEYTQILGLLTLLSSMSLEFLHIVERKREYAGFRALLGVSLVDALLLGSLLSLAAPWVAGLFHAPQLSAVIRVTIPILLVHQIRRAFKNRLQREMHFRVIALYETANVVCYVAISLFWLKVDHSLWVVFIPFFIGDIFETALLIRGQRFLPVMRDVLTHIDTVFRTLYEQRRFCLAATTTNVLNLFGSSAPILILGAFLLPDRIGVYYVAWQITALPMSLVTESMQRVFFPAFAGANEEARRIQVERFSRFVGSVVWMLLIAYAFIAMRLIPPVLGGRWSEAVGLIPALGMFVAGNILANPLSSIPMVLKRPQVEMRWTIVSIVTRCLWLGYGGWMCARGEWSLTTVIFGYGALGLALYIALYAIVLRMLKIRVMGLLRQMIPILVLQAGMLIVFALVGDHLSFWGAGIALILTILALYIADRLTAGELRSETKALLGMEPREE